MRPSRTSSGAMDSTSGRDDGVRIKHLQHFFESIQSDVVEDRGKRLSSEVLQNALLPLYATKPNGLALDSRQGRRGRAQHATGSTDDDAVAGGDSADSFPSHLS